MERRAATVDRGTEPERETRLMKCDVKGCKHAARWVAHKLFGDRKTLHVCDACKPDPAKRPENLRHLPFFYRVEPLEITKG
jgi:hypothetical protein